MVDGRTFQQKLAHDRIAEAVRDHGPLSTQAVMDEFDVVRSTARRYIRAVGDRDGFVVEEPEWTPAVSTLILSEE